MSVVLTYNDPKLNGTIEFMVRAMDATSRRTIHEHRFDLKDLDACATFARQAAHMLGIASVEPLLFEQLCAKLLEVTADMPRMRSVRDLCAAHPKLRAPVIEGVLREGETMNLISAPKIGKSWLAQQLAISIAAERMWLGRFAVEPGNVLIIDNELHSETLAHRIPKVAAAVGVTLSELGDRLFVESFRGRLRDIYQMGSYFKHIDRGRFKLIIIDAFYRILPAGVDENSNADIAAIYNQIDRYADEMQTAFCLIHHSSKGIQAAKAVTDVGAGAGSQSRATDAHVIIRQHEEDNGAVVEAAVRSWAPMEPFCLRWDFPVWKLAEDLDPADLRVERRRKRTEKAGDGQEAEPPVVWTVEKFVQSFVTERPLKKDLILARAAIVGSARLGSQLLTVAEAELRVHRWTFPKDRTVYYATVEQGLEFPPETHTRAHPPTPPSGA